MTGRFISRLKSNLTIWLKLTRYEIEGNSMSPTLRAGDWILVEKVKASQIEEGFISSLLGEIVVVEVNGLRQIKRLVRLEKGELGKSKMFLLGDNSEASTDSRHYGALELDSLRGVFYRRYGKANEKRSKKNEKFH